MAVKTCKKLRDPWRKACLLTSCMQKGNKHRGQKGLIVVWPNVVAPFNVIIDDCVVI